MKVKISITLSEDLLRTIDKIMGENKNRSDFIETALREFIKSQVRLKQNQRDLEIIDKNYQRLNEEARDVLLYQTDI